jgi:hypothetical protein
MDKSYSATDGNIVKTTDGGDTWTAITPTAGRNFSYDVAYVPGTGSTWVATDDDYANNLMGARYSTDNGTTWMDMPTTIGTQLLANSWINDSTGWAGGFNTDATTGGMYKFNGHLVSAIKVWTGSSDVNWQNPDNWNPSVLPTSADNVIIPGTALHMPNITIQGYSCHDLTIMEGATVTVSPGIILTINGKITINH